MRQKAFSLLPHCFHFCSLFQFFMEQYWSNFGISIVWCVLFNPYRQIYSGNLSQGIVYIGKYSVMTDFCG